MISIVAPIYWEQYELIDSGNFKKLERFGKYVLIRPEPQAIWEPALSEKEWKRLAHAEFVPDKHQPFSGKWVRYKELPQRWIIGYRSPEVKLRSYLYLGNFKNIGLFPEQAVNWDYIVQRVRRMQNPKVLNLFAYTGMASIAARVAGAEVVHVDATKSAVTKARENMLLNGVGHIRWIVEDSRKFVQREVRRNHKYNGIIMDPPAYGRGPRKEIWQLEKHLDSLLADCAQILKQKDYFLIINVYSLGLSALVLENLIHRHFSHFEIHKFELIELFLPEQQRDFKLPAGVLLRIRG